MGQIQSIDEFIGLLVRRRLLICAVTVFGVVMTLLYVISKPDVFESAAVIQVQGATVADPGATAPTAGQSAQRLQAIEQRLTTRENVLAVIARHHLYEGLPLTEDQKVYMLRSAVRFQTIDAVASAAFGAPPQVSALLISAQADTREKAARVANDFAQSVLDAGAEGQSDRAREALAFYQREDARLSAEIKSVDAAIADYKNRNAELLPTQRQPLQEQVTGLENSLRELDQTLVAATAERDVALARVPQRATDKRQAEDLTSQIDTLTVQRKSLTDQRDAAQKTLAQIPDVERELAGYERNLDQLQDQYQQVTRKLADADTAQKLEASQQGENFTLLERATEADYPISGGRRKLAMAGGVASLLLGLGIAFLLDLLHPVLRTRTQLERELDLRAVVAIPELPNIGTGRGAGILQKLRAPKLLGGLSERPNGLSPLLFASPGPGEPQNLPAQFALIGSAAVVLLVVVGAALT